MLGSSSIMSTLAICFLRLPLSVQPPCLCFSVFCIHHTVTETQRLHGEVQHDRPLLASGSRILKTLPFPTSLSTTIVPLCASTMCFTRDRPSPLPFTSWTSPFPTR